MNMKVKFSSWFEFLVLVGGFLYVNNKLIKIRERSYKFGNKIIN